MFNVKTQRQGGNGADALLSHAKTLSCIPATPWQHGPMSTMHDLRDAERVAAPGLGAPSEWPTLALLAATYALWAVATAGAGTLGLWLAVPLTALCLTQHSSLQHEVLHGHPFRSRALSEATVFPALGLLIPYGRFRDLHLKHHQDEHLTDPYDDPESNYLDPSVWALLPRPARALLRANNTLLGRMALGPAIGMAAFLRADWRAATRGPDAERRAVRRAWALHALGVAPVLVWLAMAGTMPAWAYGLAAYLGLSVLKIRTFLEHRAHEKAAGRTVVIEDCGPLALLFLNNNFHAVHHAQPRLAWHALPRAYAARRAHWLGRNRGYRYRSYAAVFRRHLLTAKDPVPHPLRPDPLRPSP